VVSSGPYVHLYTDEVQAHGEVGDNLIMWTLGGFYQDLKIPVNHQGIRNIARVFGGITLPTLGFNPSFPFIDGGDIKEKALYGQATLDVSRLTPFIEGLHVTGGARYTWSDTRLDQVGVVTNVATGAYVPGAQLKSAVTQSSGWNTTISVDAQL